MAFICTRRLRAIVAPLVFTGALVLAGPALASVTSIVNSTADDAYSTTTFPHNDCVASGIVVDVCTLRAAIQRANANGGGAIDFDIPGNGGQTIAVGATGNGPLPPVGAAVTIDGTTQPGYAGTPLIELNGAGAGGDGLDVEASNVTIRALTINRFQGAGIHAEPVGGGVPISGLTVTGSYLGPSATGTGAVAGNQTGIELADVTGSTIGGSGPGEGDVISNNSQVGVEILSNAVGADESSGNLIEGNELGTNADGTAALANGSDGVLLWGAASNTVTGNVVSGNGRHGIDITSSNSCCLATGNVVTANTVGLNAARTAPLANSGDGVVLEDASSTTIGGTAAGSGNVIGGNDLNGVLIDESSPGPGNPNMVEGSFIGTNPADNPGLGNGGNGVYVVQGESIGIGTGIPSGGNVITDNGGEGVRIDAGTMIGVGGNSITGNAGLELDLLGDGVTPNDYLDADSGPNNLQNFPIITQAVRASTRTTVKGTLYAAASAPYGVEVYASQACDPSGYGGGAQFLGVVSVTTNAAGVGNFSVTVPTVAQGAEVTATASDPTGNYSEFSPCTKAAPPNVPQVSAQDFAFIPLTVRVARGGTVQWNFGGPSPHTVTDATGMALYDSGVKTAGQTFTEKFNAAGSFAYTSTVERMYAMSGVVNVPVKVSAASPSSVTVTWAAAAPPAGLVEDIQVKRPGSTSFTNWLTSQTGTSATFSPDAGAGTYSFHARERKSADGTASAWSPIATIKVS